MKSISPRHFSAVISSNRTVHFILKPTEEGISDPEMLPPPVKVRTNLDLLPGRLTMHLYENKISYNNRFLQRFIHKNILDKDTCNWIINKAEEYCINKKDSTDLLLNEVIYYFNSNELIDQKLNIRDDFKIKKLKM